MEEWTAKNIARYTALGALFLIPFTPLIVYDHFFFPFITGKAFYFRILVEIAFAAWVVLALLDRNYRPRLSLVGGAVLAFVFWMLIADSFAPNAAKAFWSNFERMEGWVLLAHLLGFFFAMSGVLRAENKWRAWFYTSLGVAVAVSLYGLFQQIGIYAIHQGSTRIDSRFGNSAYFAIYLLFNIFIAGWLAYTARYPWLTYALLSFAAVEAVLIFFTETRGTVLGLAFALALTAFLTLFTAGAATRRRAAFGLALIALLAGSLYLARTTSFVRDNHMLERIASISLQEGATRFTIWHMAWQGFLERPIVGWGQEGFNYVFNQFYDPSLYQQETWFDRAHNAFIDWLSAGGAPAFLLYLSLFGTALWLLWRNSSLSRPERILITAALAGYAVHNFFVFDNLYSYVYFFAILAFIDAHAARAPRTLGESRPELSPAAGMAYALPVTVIALAGVIWYVNVPGMRAASELIDAISPTAIDPTSGAPQLSKENIATFEDLLTHPAFAAQEIREQLVSFAAQTLRSSWATNAQKQQVALLAINEMRAEVAAYPLDARIRLQLAYAYRIAGDDKDALRETEAALKLSPNKEQIWIEMGATAWDMGDVQTARADFNKAYELGPQFKELATYAAAGDLAADDKAAASKVLMSAYATTTVDSDILAVAYYRTKDWGSLIRLWQLRANAPSATSETWYSLAAAYYTAGDKADAIRAVREGIARAASSTQEQSRGEALLNQLNAKRAP